MKIPAVAYGLLVVGFCIGIGAAPDETLRFAFELDPQAPAGKHQLRGVANHSIYRNAGMAARDGWLRERLLECVLPRAGEKATLQPVTPRALLEVLANNDPVRQNRIGDRPIKVGQREYTRGLYCHAISKVVVRLPGAGKSFTAVAGLDNNPDTARGRGSVVFSVRVGEEVRFQSDVMRYETPPREVSVDLAGADTFVLEIGDAGDGIGWDQSDWADAKATLQDGTELWLGDMPLVDLRPANRQAPRTSHLPFAFFYGDEPSDAFLSRIERRVATRKLDENRTQHTLTWIDPDSGLETRCVAIEYSDFPALEWTVYLRNAGKRETPILEAIQGLDAKIDSPEPGEFVLHHWKGDTCGPDLYAPLRRELPPRASVRFAPSGGRGTNGQFPYYYLATPGGGVLLAVGWPGQWATTFTRDEAHGLRVVAGQELTRLILKPGEMIRTPLIAMLFREGTDLQGAHNLWRRWMWAHNVPRDGEGRLPPPIQFGCTSGIYNEMLGANEENQKFFIDRFLEEGIRLDYWWMDAGWYPCGGQWWNVGTWEPDRKRFPNGLRAISDHARAKGVKTLVWFEPERVKEGWHGAIRQEWVLGGQLLNLGNPDAWHWLADHVARTISEQGIDLYRQDFNMDPLGFWRGNDDHNRLGITENLHVQGYLAYWDELRRRHPHLIIDSKPGAAVVMLRRGPQS